jgi:hypothetical protein
MQHSNYGTSFLRKLSEVYDRYFSQAEQDAKTFGGYAAQLIRPGRTQNIGFNPGKLRGYPPLLIGDDGLAYFADE